MCNISIYFHSIFDSDEPLYGFDIDPDNAQTWPMTNNIDYNNFNLSESEEYIRLNNSLPEELFDNNKISIKNRECDDWSQDEKIIDLNPALMEPMISSQEPDNFAEEIEHISAQSNYSQSSLHMTLEDTKLTFDTKSNLEKSFLINDDPMLGYRFNSRSGQKQHIDLYANSIPTPDDKSNDSIKLQDEMRHVTMTTTNKQITNEDQGAQSTSWAAEKQKQQPLRLAVAFNVQTEQKTVENDLSTPQIIESVIEMDGLAPNNIKNFDLVEYINESFNAVRFHFAAFIASNIALSCWYWCNGNDYCEWFPIQFLPSNMLI